MSEKFDIPHKSEMLPKMLELGTPIQFRCHPGISCFNACCKQADVTLTPYDIIRLKDRVGKGATEFLKDHTVPFQMDQDGMLGVKLRTDDEGACLFVTEQGCSVYEDRPTACRYYPLGHMAMRPTGAAQEETHYFMVKEDHCKGHEEDRELSIQEYLEEQQTRQHDEMNKEWLTVLLKKRSAGPTVGRPPESTLQLFFMASYDMDRMRRFVLSENFRSTYELGDAVYETLEKEDVALMRFGVRLMRQVFFGERSIPERAGAWDQRVTQRQEVWDARREAEMARKVQADDQKYKDLD